MALLETVLASLDDDKAADVLTIPLEGKSTIADYMVIATGTSSRQVSAMADHVIKALKDQNIQPSCEGLSQGDWVLIDAGDLIVHLFRPEVREFYNIEKIWAVDGPSDSQSAAAT